jgi:ABC-2 type transport system ATP-binding protein
MIRTEDLCKRYRGAGAMAVDRLSIQVAEGAIQGILGPNGAGKTTTLSMISGLLRPDSGTITFGAGIGGGDIRASIGYVPQELALYPGLTGRENLSFFARLYRVKGPRAEQRMDGILEMVGLADRADDPVRRYSSGMRRRLNLAAGLVHSPAVLLLDEPTVGIDPQSRNRIFEAVADLKRGGVTILYTTNYIEEAHRLCDVVAIMDRGRILLEGAPADLVREHGRVRMEFGAPEAGGNLVERVSSAPLVVDASLESGLLTVQLEGRADAMEAIGRIDAISDQCGVQLCLRSIAEPSLETIFLDITGRDLKDGTAEGWDA